MLGGVANAFAEMSTANGSQTIGNVNSYYYDQTDTIALAGGSGAGSYARIGTTGSQAVRSSGDLTLTGGVGTGSGAGIFAGSGQSLTALGNLSMVGGSGGSPGANETAIRNTSSGSQNIFVSGNLSITGGGFGSDTWIKQDGAGGAQSISAGGNLALLSPLATPNTGVTSIESLGASQSITAGGALTVDNQAGWLVYIASSGVQTITADSLAVSLSSENLPGPFAGLQAAGNQDIVLGGDGATSGTATLSVVNLSSQNNSSAAITSAANQSILMERHAAGLLKIGDINGEGLAKISAGGDQTILAGEILMQGGTGPGSDAKLHAPATMTISTLFGGLTMNGGLNGAVSIDPTQLDIVVNGPLLLQAGTNSTANATITAGVVGQPGTVNIAATNGRVSLIQSAAATATINGFKLPLVEPKPFFLIDSAGLINVVSEPDPHQVIAAVLIPPPSVPPASMPPDDAKDDDHNMCY